MKQSRLETKLDLMAIIEGAFYEYDDYASECHNKGIEVHECVEAFVADAIIKAGYVKQNVTYRNYDAKVKRIEEHYDLTDTIYKSGYGLHRGDCYAIASQIQERGFCKQSEGRWVNNHCSVCGMTPIGEEIWEMLDITPPKYERCMDYCPNFGAKMKGGEE